MKKKLISLFMMAVMVLSMVPAMAAGGDGSGGGKGNGGGKGGQHNVPTLVSTIPADGAVDVELDQVITLQFSNNVTWSNKGKEHMYLNNVKLVTLKDAEGASVEAQVTAPEQDKKDANSKEYQKLFVKPAQALEPGAVYTVEIAAGIVANNGQASKDAYKVSFTTKSAETPWYSDALDFVNEGDLFRGSTTAFSANTVMTRGLVVQVLHNLEKNPTYTTANTFADVAEDSWYFDAVVWASEKGIVNGNGLGYAPEEGVTREQLATILWRYSGKPEAGTKAAFADQDQVSSYAVKAVDWAAEAGLLQGMADNTLAPRAGVTHAQAATMIMRLAAAAK